MDKIHKDISISIVLYKNTEEEICSLLNSLSDTNFKIFLIDNSPTDILCSLTKKFSFVNYIFNNKNLGYGKAHNIAIRTSISEGKKYHIVLNPDIELNKQVVNDLIDYMDNNQDVGLSMPNIVYPNYERQFLCKLLPNPFNLIFRRFIPTKFFKDKYNSRFELHHANYNTDFFAPSLSGCFMFLRTDILKKINGFDEQFFMYCEDIDLCRRVNTHGKTMYVPTSPVIHHYNKESYRSYKLLFHHIHSAIQYFNKWGWFFDRNRNSINKSTLSQLK